MASRNPHSGDSQPGPSWAASEADRRMARKRPLIPDEGTPKRSGSRDSCERATKRPDPRCHSERPPKRAFPNDETTRKLDSRTTVEGTPRGPESRPPNKSLDLREGPKEIIGPRFPAEGTGNTRRSELRLEDPRLTIGMFKAKFGAKKSEEQKHIVRRDEDIKTILVEVEAEKKKDRIAYAMAKLDLPPVVVKEKMIWEIKKEVEDNQPPLVTVKMEVEEEWNGVKKEVIEGRVGKEIKKELMEVKKDLKEVKMEGPVGVKPPTRNVYYHHHTWFRPSPKKEEKRPTGRHANELSQGGYYQRLYKVVYDPTYMTNLKTKDFVRRYSGKCGDKYKQFDHPHTPMDPRIKYRRVDQPKDMLMPNFTVDDQFVGIPPKREVTIANLNDNANKDFLEKYTRNQKLEPQEVHVFYHPMTRKHLGLALILFQKSGDARAFVEANNGAKVMGIEISCTFDPFAALLASQYAKLTQSPLPALQYLEGMSEHELSLRREKITGSAAAAAPTDGAAPAAGEYRNRSLSPMDTSNSPAYEAPPPPPPVDHPLQQQAFYDDAGASTFKMSSPPPPYSELPPSNHGVYEERRPDSQKRSMEPEGKPRRDKRRRTSTSSSSSYSSGGEGHSNGSSSRRRADGGVKKKREEYLKVKSRRYVSSERDSNGDKRILKEVKTVTYKRRTEQRTTLPDQKTPDSFDEEMERRRQRSMSKGKRSAESRGRDGMGWSSPSSDSDNGRGGRGRKRAKEHADGVTKDDERRPPAPADAAPTTPAHSSCSGPSASLATPSRRSGFQSAPIFDPTQPPPVIVPPVGLVLPVTPALAPHLAAPPPPPMMMQAPPPLPGGFIPPPELFGFASNAAMMAAMAGAMPPLPASLPPLPPPMMTPTMMTPGYGGQTPLPYTSPVKAAKAHISPLKASTSSTQLDELVAAAAAAATVASSSPSVTSSGLPRAASASSLTASGKTPGATGTPPTSSDGGSTPRAAASAASAAAAAEKKEKANLDDRLVQLFGIKKSKKDEETRGEMKHVSSAPSISSMASAAEQKKQRDDDDIDIDDDDDAMDVASSSSEGGKMGRRDERGAESRENEEERKRKEEAERNRMKQEWNAQTKRATSKLMDDLTNALTRDLHRKLEMSALSVIDGWEKKQKSEGEEKKKQMLRDSIAAAQARQTTTPKKDPMEEMLAKKLLSPEGTAGGISKVFSSINIVKKKNLAADFSRDGTPASRDSRQHSRSKSRSSSRSSSSSSADVARRRRSQSSQSADSSADSDDEEEARRRERREKMKKRPNMRNIESSQESTVSSSSDSSDSDDDDRDKENESASPFVDNDVDMAAMSEDEAEKTLRAIKEEGASSPEAGPSSSARAAAAAAAARAAAEEQEVKKEEEDYEEEPSGRALPAAAAAPPPPVSAAEAARRAAAAQAELLRLQPSMRPDAGGYDPVRYDHPYVRQLGMPVYSRAMAYVRKPTTFKPVTAATAPATKMVPPPSLPAPVVAAPPPVKPKPAKKKKVQGEKVPQEILGLLPCAVPKDEKKRRPRVAFKKRTEQEEDFIRDGFKAGMDGEDEKFLQIMLARLQLNGARPFGVQREIEFESRLRAYTPRELPRPKKHGRVESYYNDEDLTGIVPHSTGCARAEGFYRLSTKQKIRIMRRPEAFQDRTEINERDEVVTRHQVQAQKEQRSMNRRLQTMVDSNPNSEFFKVNQLKYRKKMIKFARSRIHGWGLYALEPIAPDDMIVEYIGQKIRPIVADEREKAYERRGIGSSYLFRIDEDEVIDATRQGNFARFINHSCQPNCYAKVVTVDGDKRIVIYSKSLIQKGDEITYDYKFPLEDEKIECLCGAPSCRGFLN